MNLIAEERIGKTTKLLHSIADGKKLKILEIGPGKDGIFINNLNGDFEKYAVDIEKFKFPGVVSKIADMNDEPIPFQDNFFDLIICCEVVEHLWNADNVLFQANKKLKKGGILVLSTPNLTSLVSRVGFVFGKYPGVQGALISLAEWPGGHIRCYNVQTMKYLLGLYGFKVEKVIGASSGIFLRKFFEWYPPFATYMLFYAKKEKEAEPVRPV